MALSPRSKLHKKQRPLLITNNKLLSTKQPTGNSTHFDIPRARVSLSYIFLSMFCLALCYNMNGVSRAVCNCSCHIKGEVRHPSVYQWLGLCGYGWTGREAAGVLLMYGHSAPIGLLLDHVDQARAPVPQRDSALASDQQLLCSSTPIEEEPKPN